MLLILTGLTATKEHRRPVIQKVKEFPRIYLCNQKKSLEIDELYLLQQKLQTTNTFDTRELQGCKVWLTYLVEYFTKNKIHRKN